MGVKLTFGKPPEPPAEPYWTFHTPAFKPMQYLAAVPEGAEQVQVSVKETHVQFDWQLPGQMLIGANMFDLPVNPDPLGFKQLMALGKRAARLVNILSDTAELIDVSNLSSAQAGELWDALDDLKKNGPSVGQGV